MKRYLSSILIVFFISATMLFPAVNGMAGNSITRDPFARPDLAIRKNDTVVKKRGKSPGEFIREEAAQLKLRGIIRNGDWAMANINGTMVEEGDTIEGFTLLWIGEADVLLRKEGVEVILVMEKSNDLPTL